MREDICSIPVSEIFEVKDGCPFCRMYDSLEKRAVDFITGDAMMEPDVRIETNREGFCPRHYSRMLERRARLPLALMLESHLAGIQDNVLGKQPLFSKDSGERAAELCESCFVCEKIEKGTRRFYGTFFKLWVNEPEFRETVKGQPFYCLPHYAVLMRTGKTLLNKKQYAAFSEMLTAHVRETVRALNADVTEFCRMFDYRNSGTEMKGEKDSVERTVRFLSGMNK